MKKILLDTNAYSALMKGVPEIKTIIENAEQVFMPIIVLGEILSGFKNGNREQENTKILNTFLDLPGISVLNTSEETASIYSEILQQLRKAGTPIPTNDIWISALSVETGSVIITYDKHFLNVAQARIWKNE